ncbi:unnamed protein product [Closterium sp. Naga37s-1]|nr:unnamed protein product [Closterium sp. Naga37s-1]
MAHGRAQGRACLHCRPEEIARGAGGGRAERRACSSEDSTAEGGGSRGHCHGGAEEEHHDSCWIGDRGEVGEGGGWQGGKAGEGQLRPHQLRPGGSFLASAASPATPRARWMKDGRRAALGGEGQEEEERRGGDKATCQKEAKNEASRESVHAGAEGDDGEGNEERGSMGRTKKTRPRMGGQTRWEGREVGGAWG